MTPHDMARYAEFSMFRDKDELQTQELYEPVSGTTYTYHHHEIWPDKLVSGVAAIPLRTLIKSRSGAVADTRLSMTVDVEKKDFLDMVGKVLFVPLDIPSVTLDLGKMFLFNAEEIAYCPYEGLLPGLPAKKVKSMLIFARQDGVWKILDGDYGKKFIDRHIDVLFSTLPHVVQTPFGNYGVPWEAEDVTSVVSVTYSDDLSLNTVTFSRRKMRGIALCNGVLVYDGFSEFSDVPVNFMSLSASDEKHPWRVRFAKRSAIYYGGFLFQKIPDDLLYNDLRLEDIEGYPPDVQDKLSVLCCDYDPYC